LAGGVLATASMSCVVKECLIEWNTGTFGGGLFGDGIVMFTHNLIVGNSATNICGGLGVSGVSMGVVSGNTLDRNSTASGAGGINLASATIQVFNNVVTNSTGAGIACSGSPPALLDFNNVWNASGGLYSGCTAGAWSISADPGYVDTTITDYHLGVHSPCIDRGRTGATYNDPDGSRGDMGWYGSHLLTMDQPAFVHGLSVGWQGSDRVLDWNPSPAPDVAQYAIYADASSGFVPSAANLVAFVAAPATSFNVGPVASDTYYKVNAIDDDNYAGGYSNEASASASTDTEPIVFRNRLLQNSPNPFNPETEIRFELAATSDVSITVFDAVGRLIRVLEGGNRPAGVHAVRWNGRDDSGQPVSSGVYFYRMKSSNFDQTRKMVLLK